jgi:hypothetical protein
VYDPLFFVEVAGAGALGVCLGCSSVGVDLSFVPNNVAKAAEADLTYMPPINIRLQVTRSVCSTYRPLTYIRGFNSHSSTLLLASDAWTFFLVLLPSPWVIGSLWIFAQLDFLLTSRTFEYIGHHRRRHSPLIIDEILFTFFGCSLFLTRFLRGG